MTAASMVFSADTRRSERLPSALYQCKSFDQQCAWVQAQLERGRTLTDPGIWLGGADPDKVIRFLRKKGLAIKTVRKATVDAAGERHSSVAWRLYQEGEARPAPRRRIAA